MVHNFDSSERLRRETTEALRVDYPPPRPVIPVFEGDPLNYSAFASRFQAHVTNRVASADARLTYLLQHCSVQVRQRIDHYVGAPSNFERAWE